MDKSDAGSLQLLDKLHLESGAHTSEQSGACLYFVLLPCRFGPGIASSPFRRTLGCTAAQNSRRRLKARQKFFFLKGLSE
jgi:hypothetical protein